MITNAETITYRLIKAVLRIASIVPRKILVLAAYPLGMLWYILDHYHRDIAFDNMLKAFDDEWDEPRCRRTVRSNFVQLFRVALELPSLLRINARNLDSFVEISGEEYVKEALAKKPGVLFLTAHLGNWELMALATSVRYRFPFDVMVRPLDFKPMDRMLTEIRSRTGNIVLEKDKSAGVVGELLQKSGKIGILLDQNSSWYDGVYVPFFGRTACTNKGLAIFAIRYGATVLPAFNIRLRDGRYRIIFGPPVSLIRTGDISRDVVENTKLFNDIIEKHIRLAPDNWLWVHRRWRIKAVPEHARKKLKRYADLPFS